MSVSWATVEDLRKRWPGLPPTDPEYVQLLLDDAAQYLLDLDAGVADAPLRSRVRVVTAIVRRTLEAGLQPTMQGVESVQMGAGPFQFSAKPVNAAGEFWITRQERLSLGIGRQRAGQVDLLAGGDDAVPSPF